VTPRRCRFWVISRRWQTCRRHVRILLIFGRIGVQRRCQGDYPNQHSVDCSLAGSCFSSGIRAHKGPVHLGIRRTEAETILYRGPWAVLSGQAVQGADNCGNSPIPIVPQGDINCTVAVEGLEVPHSCLILGVALMMLAVFPGPFGNFGAVNPRRWPGFPARGGPGGQAPNLFFVF